MEASQADGRLDVGEPSRIGERLRAERQRKGMTVREIARRIGVSPSLISQIERDKVNPSVAHAVGARHGARAAHGRPLRKRRRAARPAPGRTSGIERAGHGRRRSRDHQPRDRRVLGATDRRPAIRSSSSSRSSTRPERPRATRTLSSVTAGRSTATSSAACSASASASTSTSSVPAWRSRSTRPRPIASGPSAHSRQRRSGSSSAGRPTGAAR